MKKQLDSLNSFVSRRPTKDNIYNDRSYNGALPQNVSKRLRSKNSCKSKTPRSTHKKYKLSFGNPFAKDDSYKKRSNTSANFYPSVSDVPYNVFDKTPKAQSKSQLEEKKNDFKSFESSKQRESSAADQDGRSSKLSISQTKFTINPSPYKRREKSIDELIKHLQKQITDLEVLETKKGKGKHMQGMRPTKKAYKKSNSKYKARSHSPQSRVRSEKVTISHDHHDEKSRVVPVSPTPDQLTTIQPKAKKKIVKGVVRKIKKEVQASFSTIEPESKVMKPRKSIIAKDKPRPKSKLSMNPKKGKHKSSKIVKKSKISKTQLLKNKMKAILRINLQIHKRAAVVIQRWYRRVKASRNTSKQAPSLAVNKDIASLKSSGQELPEHKVIVDIRTSTKDEIYNRNRLPKRSRHNFSFGNSNYKLEDTPEEAAGSKDTDFERYKRKKREEREYQFKKKGRNMFDSDKGEEAEEAYDYYDVKSFNDNYEISDFDLRRKKKGKLYAKTVNEEQEKKLEFSSNMDISMGRPESGISSTSEHEDR